jgi:hypothetical protein
MEGVNAEEAAKVKAAMLEARAIQRGTEDNNRVLELEAINEEITNF